MIAEGQKLLLGSNSESLMGHILIPTIRSGSMPTETMANLLLISDKMHGKYPEFQPI